MKQQGESGFKGRGSKPGGRRTRRRPADSTEAWLAPSDDDDDDNSLISPRTTKALMPFSLSPEKRIRKKNRLKFTCRQKEVMC